MQTPMPHLLAYRFGDQEIEFDITSEEVMINATEMAAAFGKEPYEFLRLEQTKRFITAMESAFPAFKTGAAPVLNAGNALSESENSVRTGANHLELVRAKRGRDDSGATWMHRTLALKFAAWLSPEFEVWIYQTIEQVLFAHGQRIGQEVREKARLLDRREELKQELLQGSPLFLEYLDIDFKIRQANNRMVKHNTAQLSIFRQSA